MSDLNQCTFIGRLGADPEVKTFSNGGRICNFRMAVSEQWTDKKSGEKKEFTEWVSVTIQSDGLVGIAERFLRKGSKVLVQGKQRTRKWQDQNGNDRYSTECVLSSFDGKLQMLDSKPADGGCDDSTTHQNDRGSQWGGPVDDLDDDCPF